MQGKAALVLTLINKFFLREWQNTDQAENECVMSVGRHKIFSFLFALVFKRAENCVL